MSRLGRMGAASLIVLASALAAHGTALATHCPPDHPPHPPGVPDNYPCPQPATPTPKATPTPAPTVAPTAAPTSRPITRTAAPIHRVSTPEPTAFPIEVPAADADATPQIVMPSGPIDNEGDSFNVPPAEQAGAASNWIFGFIVGFIVGGFIGRASWGLRKRRRQQIFG